MESFCFVLACRRRGRGVRVIRVGGCLIVVEKGEGGDE